MPFKPTINPRKDHAASPSISPGSKRKNFTVTFGQQTGANNFMLMRGDGSAPRVKSVYVNTNAAMYHAAAEADTWIFNLINATDGSTLNSVAASLSNQTLTATGWKEIPVNNGNSTLGSGEGLQVQISESGTAQTLDEVGFAITWEPTLEV